MALDDYSNPRVRGVNSANPRAGNVTRTNKSMSTTPINTAIGRDTSRGTSNAFRSTPVARNTPVADIGVDKWNARVEGPLGPLRNQANANYKSTWANNLAYSQLAPQYSLLKNNTETSFSNLMLNNRESDARSQYAREDQALANARINSDLTGANDAYARSREKGAVDNAGITIDQQMLERQKDYLSQMLGYTNRDIDLRQNIHDVDLGAVERQFPLLKKERGDITALQQNLLANLQAKDESATKDERVNQLDLISQAAAQGSAGAALPVAHAQRVAEQLQESLAQSDRDRREADINYQAALRKNTENMAQARDAKEKINLEKQRVEIERQRAAAEAAEAEKRRQEDVQRKALERFYVAIQLKQAQDQLAAQQRQAMLSMKAAADEQARTQFFLELKRQQDLQTWNTAVAANQAQQAELDRQRFFQALALQSQAPNRPAKTGPTWLPWNRI